MWLYNEEDNVHPEHPQPFKNTNLFESLRVAFNGIGIFLREQRNARIHVVMTFAVMGTCSFLQTSTIETAILLLTCALVLTLECMNTAVEEVVNLASPEFHHLAGKAKDLAAAAVLLSTFFAVTLWCMLCGPKVLALL